MRPAGDLEPVGQIVGVGIGIVEEAALLDHQAPGIGAVAAGVPADRAAAGGPLDRLDRALEMRPLLGLGHVLVVDPAPAVARDLEAGLDHRPAAAGVALERHADGVDRERQAALLEQPQDPPEAGAGAVFVDRLDVQIALANERRLAGDLVQIGLRRRVTVEHAGFAALLVVEHDAERQPGAVRPVGVRRMAAVADQIARIGLGHYRILPGAREGLRARSQAPV